MTENFSENQIIPDFRSHEIHVKIDHEERTTSLTFQLVSEFHTMNRGYDELLERSLQRFAITCRSKLGKNSQKAARAAKKQSKGGQSEDAAVVVERPLPPTLLHYNVEVDPATVMNYEIQTGMQIVLDSLTFHVVVNPPTVVSLSAYPKQLPYVGCPIVPQVAIEFGDDFTCIWACETSPKSGEFVTVCTDKEYVPASTAEGCRVKLFCTALCTETARTGRAVVFYLSGAVQPAVEPAREFNRMLGVREQFNAVRRAYEVEDFNPFDTLKQAREEVGQEVRGAQELRVMTYNILAEPFATSEQAYTTLYPYCDQAVLQSEYRIQRILAEILAADADVICLQECDLRTFEAYLLPILGRRGYQGHFTCKGSTEGCAVFTYGRTCRVVARVDTPLKNVLREAGYLDNLYAQRPDLRDVIGGKLGTVAQITVLECVQRPGQAVVVANSHLFYHPLASFLRTIQCYAITQALELAQRSIEEGGLRQDFVKLLGGEETNTVALEKETRLEKSLFVGGWRKSAKESAQEACTDDRAVKATVIFCGDLNSSPNIAAMQFLRK
jgi:mRNA deadenylase 3'-5' endonuclease subunit Ccr4